MLWKILIILLGLEAFGIIPSLPLSGAIQFFIFLNLAAILIRFSKWLLAALKEVDQMLKLSI